MSEPRIHILPDDLINKIAAGEVVERPASVVKELVENSLDAGASQIVIEVQAAGKKLVRVADNGRGMTEAEIALALERHSTSKISSADDLFNIKTLGFRGEALPSIASVSKMKLGRNPSGRGVTIEVKDLFYNTPARKKFLKSDGTETGHIGDVVAKYALAYPATAFKFISDEKPLLNSPGTGQLRDAVLAVYGGELAGNLIEFDRPFPSGRVFGLVSRPTVSRIDKNYETFFVNRRYIKNFLLNRALEEACRTLIPGDRYPVGIIFIDIDPRKVDVNVHPAKREVKFVNNQEVMDAVREGVREALANVAAEPVAEIRPIAGGEQGALAYSGFFDRLPDTLSIQPENELEVTAVQPLITLYQFKLTYIVATDGEELALIDQHAAHERVLYDQLSRQSSVISQQSLLVPETIEFGAAEAGVIRENLDYLNTLGFDLAEFGPNSFILRAVPALSGRVSARQLVIDLAAELQEYGRGSQLEVKKENIRKLVACHSAIKAGDRLTAEEMNQLIRDLYATENPLTCPHGRPTMVRITENDLLKSFKR